MFQRRQPNPRPISYQTMRLGTGRHSSPRRGVCVMELASMLAGEQFTDQPRSVCPVIGSFLRAYNDSIDARRRQDLHVFAAKVLGSQASEETHRARAERIAIWTTEYVRPRQTRFFRFRRRNESLPRCIEAIGPYAVAEIPRHTDDTHASALALIDDLVAIGDVGSAPDTGGGPAVHGGELAVSGSNLAGLRPWADEGTLSAKARP
jgi:hypothetical protein